MISAALRSLNREPRAADAPERSWRDWALVGVLVVAVVTEAAMRPELTWRPLATALAVALAVLLLWRRTHPLACVALAFGTATAISVAAALVGVANVGLGTMVFVLLFVYSLVRWGSGREILIGLAIVAVAATIGSVLDYTGPVELFGGFAVLAAAITGGAALRFRSENSRRALAQARSQERVNLARELHDSVAHHVSAITVQAQAGRAIATQRPEAALEALAAIEREATRTLAEMRAMVRVLREGEPAQYAPQRGVADLAGLARRSPRPSVEVELAGEVTGLPPQLDAAVYRIAQESLTNALRHARDASRVQITLVEYAGTLRLRVTDDGRADPDRPATHGFGLIGMAERAELLGGTLRAGPTAGGWAVEAELPVTPQD